MVLTPANRTRLCQVCSTRVKKGSACVYCLLTDTGMPVRHLYCLDCAAAIERSNIARSQRNLSRFRENCAKETIIVVSKKQGRFFLETVKQQEM